VPADNPGIFLAAGRCVADCRRLGPDHASFAYFFNLKSLPLRCTAKEGAVTGADQPH
jgi:hypothetical protein